MHSLYERRHEVAARTCTTRGRFTFGFSSYHTFQGGSGERRSNQRHRRLSDAVPRRGNCQECRATPLTARRVGANNVM